MYMEREIRLANMITKNGLRYKHNIPFKNTVRAMQGRVNNKSKIFFEKCSSLAPTFFFNIIKFTVMQTRLMEAEATAIEYIPITEGSKNINGIKTAIPQK